MSYSNSAKYASGHSSSETHTDEVFERLQEINYIGVTSKNLCRRADGHGKSFRESLDRTIEVLAVKLAGKDITYIELGPEPVKTYLIVSSLKKIARSIRYVGIDINASSRVSMQRHIGGVVGESNFYYLIGDYFNINFSDVQSEVGFSLEGSTVILTSLGSQEGNEHPEFIHSVYRRLTRPDDLIISELQLLKTLNHFPVFEFSHLPLWRSVSESFRSRLFGEKSSEYGTVLVPLVFDKVGVVQCAVSTERFFEPLPNGADVLISNFCLKYTSAQLAAIRHVNGFDIVFSVKTGDEAVVFQLITPGTDVKQ